HVARRTSHVALVSALVATPVAGQITIYTDENFRGRDVAVDRPVPDLNRFGFAGQVSSRRCAAAPRSFVPRSTSFGR
ncbi:MAG: beta/gamma crystallin family protein, partial [Pseudomonadota bacterium]|nr:beta/gamma crystallin family protein [Pseudomonadota bacterium]